MELISRRRGLAALWGALLLAGCASSSPTPPEPAPALRAGLVAATPAREEAWKFAGADSARQVVTPHYVLRTTIRDDEIVQKLSQLMEGGLSQYQRLTPCLKGVSDRPLVCYLFENRRQWAQFTQAQTGEDAPVYLRINRGGYTLRDFYVAYFIGDLGTYSVAAHEGFHQYLARNFLTRPPPFLEEGLATTFEDVSWDGGLPRWDLSANPARLSGLRRAVSNKNLLPLEEICAMHAGQVVNTSAGRVEAFYAQSWAFARFCRDGEGGKYRPRLERLLCDCAKAKAFGMEGSPTGADWRWDPASAKPMLEHYLGADLGTIDREYRAFIGRLVNAQGAGGIAVVKPAGQEK